MSYAQSSFSRDLPLVDRGVEAIFRGIGRLSVPMPGRVLLSAHRLERVDAIARARRDAVEALQAAVVEGREESVREYDALVAEALGELRAERPAPIASRAAHTFDRWLQRDGDEHVDDPAVPEEIRVHVLAMIDRLNDAFGSYAEWARLLEPLVDAAPPPAHVFELAAGHGRFSSFLARRFGQRARVTATDLRAEYLALGRDEAARDGVEVRTLDATRLARLRAEGADVFVCTQSLHHFPPGMVARMIGETARVARTGACFIDAERSIVALGAMTALMGLYGRHYSVAHDTWVSLRRMYHAEELYLFARLAPALPQGARIEWGRSGPGYAFLRVWSR